MSRVPVLQPYPDDSLRRSSSSLSFPRPLSPFLQLALSPYSMPAISLRMGTPRGRIRVPFSETVRLLGHQSLLGWWDAPTGQPKTHAGSCIMGEKLMLSVWGTGGWELAFWLHSVGEPDAEPALGTTFPEHTGSLDLARSLHSLLPLALFLPTFTRPFSCFILI